MALNDNWHGAPVWVWVVGGSAIAGGAFVFYRRYKANKAAATNATGTNAGAYPGTGGFPAGAIGQPLPGQGAITPIILQPGITINDQDRVPPPHPGLHWQRGLPAGVRLLAGSQHELLGGHDIDYWQDLAQGVRPGSPQDKDEYNLDAGHRMNGVPPRAAKIPRMPPKRVTPV